VKVFLQNSDLMGKKRKKIKKKFNLLKFFVPKYGALQDLKFFCMN